MNDKHPKEESPLIFFGIVSIALLCIMIFIVVLSGGPSDESHKDNHESSDDESTQQTDVRDDGFQSDDLHELTNEPTKDKNESAAISSVDAHDAVVGVAGAAHVLAFISHRCSACNRALQYLGRIKNCGGLVIVVLPPNESDAIDRFHERHSRHYSDVFIDADSKLMDQYGAKIVPHLVVFDNEGRVVVRLTGLAEVAKLSSMSGLLCNNGSTVQSDVERSEPSESSTEKDFALRTSKEKPTTGRDKFTRKIIGSTAF